MTLLFTDNTKLDLQIEIIIFSSAYLLIYIVTNTFMLCKLCALRMAWIVSQEIVLAGDETARNIMNNDIISLELNSPDKFNPNYSEKDINTSRYLF